ncbi:MAG: cysteine rich repeat-containing protein [Hyphomicrobium sp.]|jgi:hypothetical protein|nr:cysteine rich repeat-containing protein [Hyphomicrobium sp.]
MIKVNSVTIALLTSISFSSAGWAQQGPVAAACKDDIAKYCAEKEHGRGEVRGCLEANKDALSAECKAALDSTGPGKGMGQGPGRQ